MTDIHTEGRPAAETIYWRSTSELAQTPEFEEILAREFPAGVAEGAGLIEGVSRRGFLTAVAASVAAASLTSCRKPKQKILAYTKRPEYLIPGVPLHYATALTTAAGFGVGLLVRSNDGRPTKIEGNPEHPSSLGGTTSHLQGELLNLYDPARSRNPLSFAAPGGARTASDTAAFVDALTARRNALASARGRGLHVVLSSDASPTLARLLGELRAALPESVVHRYDAVGVDNELEGARRAFGSAVLPMWSLDACEAIIAFDCDFLGTDGDVVRNTKNFAKSRKIQDASGTVSRLYVVEGSFSLTGSNADHRFKVAPSQIPAALLALAAELGVGGDTALSQAIAKFKGQAFAYKSKANWVPIVAEDLRARAGKTAIMVGPRQPAMAHAVAHAINAHLGNLGKTVRFVSAPDGLGTTGSLRELQAALVGGSVDTLVTIGCNPVYDAPADLAFAEHYAKAKHKLHIGLHVDETALASDHHCNAAHQLEAWGDVRGRDGTVSIQQPLIAPLFDGLSAIEIVARLAGSDSTEGYDLVRATHRDRASGDGFDAWWEQLLHDGLLADSAAKFSNVSLDAAAVGTLVGGWQRPSAPGSAALEVEIRADASVLDGRYSNNSWLQELPDPITKLVWDNAVLISKRTADQLGVVDGDVVSLSSERTQSTEGPVWIVPGQADHVLTVTLGYGRRMDAECTVAAGTGFDAYPLRTTTALHSVVGARVQKTGRSYQLVSSQEHGSMEGRPLYRESSLDDYKKEDPKLRNFATYASPLAKTAALKTELAKAHADHGKPDDHGEGGEAQKPLVYTEKSLLKSLWDERDYTQGYQWGMVIDLNSCTGCSACVVACASENNIPMVGKEQTRVGREMFWNRIDRYFTSDVGEDHPARAGITDDVDLFDDPGVAHQMVPCMQCENASCESVCPVAATVHSPEGLNDMAYNRCIGTRYCANNCPYKVRRFNWFNFNQDVPQTKQMQFNPNVTVRARGVMEKCTYCVQRINQAKITANNENRRVRDGEITTACAQGCPADAITFGDINDQTTAVSKLKASNLNYAMLSEMNNKPRTTYLAKIRNPNPELVGV